MKIRTDFIWLVHPLDDAQIIDYCKRTKTKKITLFEDGPRIVDEIIDTEYNLSGIVISTPLLPEQLIKKKNVMEQLELIKKLIEERVENTPPIGLGAWWATATRKGKLAKEVFPEHTIIDGYTGTVDRIVEQIYENLDGAPLDVVAIIGGGEVGKRVYDALPIDAAIIFDKYNIEELCKKDYIAVHVDKLVENIENFQIGVCCTTATKDVLTVDDIPDGFKFIDDSYPHTIPEYEGRIDGGMYENEAIFSSYLIKEGKIYGCLMELINYARNVKEEE